MCFSKRSTIILFYTAFTNAGYTVVIVVEEVVVLVPKAKLRGAKYQREKTKTGSFS